jgi:hypothetical protein
VKKTLLFVLLLLLCHVGKAQYPYYEDDRLRIGVQLAMDYDSPMGKLSFVYKPAISPNFSLLLSKSENFIVNITVGYHTYKPKAAEFYYLIDEGENYGIDTFSEYKVKTAYLGFLYELPFTETIKGVGGANFGAYFTEYETTSVDRQQISSSGFADKNLYFSPKIGVSLNLTESIACSMLAKYNMFSPTGENDPRTPIFNGGIGKLYTSWSSGIGLSYKF